MKRFGKILIYSLLISSIILSNIFVFVSGETEVKLSNVQHHYTFGSTLKINAEYETDLEPVSIEVILQPEGSGSAISNTAYFDDKKILLEFDLANNPIRPFSKIFYWFTFQYSNNTSTNSPSYWFDYVDNRFDWKTFSSKLFIIHWIENQSWQGQDIHKIATSGLENATRLLPVAPDLPIRIIVYPTTEDLQSTLHITHQTWVAGHASPDIGVVLVTAGENRENLIDLERQVPHELMHLLEYQFLEGAYTNAPVWLLEGLATYNQVYPNPDFERTLTKALDESSLIPFSDLCLAFPPDAAQANLAYTQSLSFVKFLEDRFSSAVFLQMLDESLAHYSCDQVVINTTGYSLDSLQKDWQHSLLKDAAQPVSFTKWFIPIIGCVFLFLSLFFLRKKYMKPAQND